MGLRPILVEGVQMPGTGEEPAAPAHSLRPDLLPLDVARERRLGDGDIVNIIRDM